MQPLRKRIFLIARHPVGGILTYFKYIYSQPCFDEYHFTVLVPDVKLTSVMKEIFRGRNLSFLHCEDSKDMLRVARNYLCSAKVDLVHTHGFTAGCLLSLVTPHYKVPHLMTTHDIFQSSQFVGVKGWIKRLLLSIIFNRINMIHTVGEEATENLKKYFKNIDPVKIRCIKNGIDTKRFFNVKVTNHTPQKDGNTFFIGFFGRFMPQKGFCYLVDAINIIVTENKMTKKPIVLTYGWGGFVREEFNAIEKRGLKDYFSMMPFTDKMPEAIKGVDLVVMPSLWEALPLLAIESLVAGVPIVGTNCIGLNEVLQGSPATIIHPAQARELSEAILDEMNNPQKSDFAKYSHTAKNRFSLETASAGLNKLYQQMMS